MTIQQIMTGTGGVLFLILTLVQIAPIKINPWSKLAKAIGKAINGEVLGKVDALSKDVQEIKKRQKENEENIAKRDAELCRTRILRFADELRRNIDHSEEFFDQTLDDITVYENYCDEHRGYKNNKAKAAIEKIQKTYQQCLDKDSFL